MEPTQDKKTISERRFRRNQRRTERKRKQEKEDNRFMAAVYSLTGVTAAIAIGIAVFGMNGGQMDTGILANMAQPWLGPLSKFEIFGFGFIILLGAIYFWRIRSR